MKYRSEYANKEKKKEQEWKREHKAGGFRCSHCTRWVSINGCMGTRNRNHCTTCLWSRHVDENKGDRRAECQGGMKPIGLTFKHEGIGKQGEIMLVHECAQCGSISINRIAGDDDNEKILSIFNESALTQNLPNKLKRQGIAVLVSEDRDEIYTQLFGR